MAPSYLPTFLHSQLLVTPKYPDHDFTDQIVIVTGANIGLGFEAAKHFTRLNARKVILAVRTIWKGEEARIAIEESTGRKGVVEAWNLDLTSFESVKAFAARAEQLPRLDALLENAGIGTQEFKLAEGHERTITTNVISTFYLALLLLPKLRETSKKFKITPRLTIVSSEVHYFTDLPEKSSPSIFENLRDPKTANMPARYSTSKLLEVLYVRQLAREMAQTAESPVTLNMLNPGFSYSNFLSTDDTIPVHVRILRLLLARTTEVGSRTLVTGAAAGHETHGQYMSDGIIAPTSTWVQSDDGLATGRRIWSELNDILEKIHPQITNNI